MFTSNYHPPRGSDKIRAASGPSILPRPMDICFGMDPHQDEPVELRHPNKEKLVPHPLPMPEYGGYFAPLTEFLPDSNLPSSGFHRCNVAVMLLPDIIVDGIPGLDWTLHIPTMLHISFLGLDHTRTIVRDHCKQLLLNLLTVLADHNDHLTVARVLLNSGTLKRGLGLTTPHISVIEHNFTEPDVDFDRYLFGPIVSPLEQNVHVPTTANAGDDCSGDAATMAAPGTTIPTTVASQASPTNGNSEGGKGADTPTKGLSTAENNEVISPDNYEVPLVLPPEDDSVPQPGPSMSISHVIKSLIRFLADYNNNGQPLWNYEDITAKLWTIKSADQLACFLRHILRVFSDSYLHARIAERWAQTALQLGLSCSSRHYAGRSLQIFRALNVPISSRMLSDVLSRLIETVAEQGEDMQGYVTELLLTLEAAVDSLDSDFRPLDVMKDIFKSTPNLNNKDGLASLAKKSNLGASGNSMHGGGGGMGVGFASNSAGHTRSTSYSVSYCTRKSAMSPADKQAEMRMRCSALEPDRSSMSKLGLGAAASSLSRSRSAQSLKLMSTDSVTQDDKMMILAQLFWLAVSLLESDYEHEFLLALRLLTRVLYRLPLDRPDARDKVEKLQQQLKWNGYPGVHALLLKGCTYPTTYEPTVTLLSQFAPLLTLPVCDPTQSCAFPMNVIALLPYMLLHYEEANEVCIRSAEKIALVAAELGSKLENLGTVMNLYSRKTFSKESFQWTKCVVKYLHDTYAHMGLHMLAFLVEVLEKGWHQVQLQVLSVIHCMLHYIDLSTPQARSIGEDLLRVISKFLDGVHWKEASKILKLIVTRSSSLQVVPQQMPTQTERYSSSSFFSHGSYSDSEVMFKKELAGRTMDFSFDVSQTPLIGRRILLKAADGGDRPSAPYNTVSSQQQQQQQQQNQQQQPQSAMTPNSPRRSMSLSPADTIPLIGWKRPWMCQGRVRECLVNLLTTCGQRVGLPKSPSVIFSQSSDLMERQSSAASSTDETSGPHQDLSGGSRRDDGQPDFGVFKDFDFLEYESESIEGESTDNFNWGVRRRLLSDDSEPMTSGGGSKSHSATEDYFSDKTPVSKRRHIVMDDSSDDEGESESPLDEDQRTMFQKNLYGGPPTSLSLRERARRRDSISRSDTSGSSAGDLGDLTPCNASPHMPGLMPYRAVPVRNDEEELWRSNLQGLLLNQPSSHAPVLLNQLYLMVKELTTKSVVVARDCIKLFTGSSSQLGSRISVLVDLLATKSDPPRIWYDQGMAVTPRLHESLRFGVLEIQEHLETFFDRKDHVKEVRGRRWGLIKYGHALKGSLYFI